MFSSVGSKILELPEDSAGITILHFSHIFLPFKRLMPVCKEISNHE